MVTVAKNFDAPVKLLFPKNIFADVYQFSMLGLGDIVIPGIVVALMLRFDRKNWRESGAQSNSPKSKEVDCEEKVDILFTEKPEQDVKSKKSSTCKYRKHHCIIIGHFFLFTISRVQLFFVELEKWKMSINFFLKHTCGKNN